MLKSIEIVYKSRKIQQNGNEKQENILEKIVEKEEKQKRFIEGHQLPR